MRINVFAKTRTTEDGKKFKVYGGRIQKKDGTEDYVNIKFKEVAGTPVNNPCTIVVNKADCNLATRIERYNDNTTGEDKEVTVKTLWVERFNEEEYIDTSLDEYEFD